jgi:hypothetical protein
MWLMEMPRPVTLFLLVVLIVLFAWGYYHLGHRLQRAEHWTAQIKAELKARAIIDSEDDNDQGPKRPNLVLLPGLLGVVALPVLWAWGWVRSHLITAAVIGVAAVGTTGEVVATLTEPDDPPKQDQVIDVEPGQPTRDVVVDLDTHPDQQTPRGNEVGSADQDVSSDPPDDPDSSAQPNLPSSPAEGSPITAPAPAEQLAPTSVDQAPEEPLTASETPTEPPETPPECSKRVEVSTPGVDLEACVGAKLPARTR